MTEPQVQPLTEAQIRRIIRQEIASMFSPTAVQRFKLELKGTVMMPNQVSRQIDPVAAAIERAMWKAWRLV
jgi:hypothetical protein